MNKHTWEDAKKILFADGKLLYPALQINNEIPKMVWVKIKHEKLGLTAQFGYEGSEKIESHRWYPGGLTDFKLWLLNAGIITE